MTYTDVLMEVSGDCRHHQTICEARSASAAQAGDRDEARRLKSKALAWEALRKLCAKWSCQFTDCEVGAKDED